MRRTRSWVLLSFIILCLLPNPLAGYGLSNLTSNDPFPLYTTQFPQDFNLWRTRLHYMCLDQCFAVPARHLCVDEPGCWAPYESTRYYCTNPSCSNSFLRPEYIREDESASWCPLILSVSATVFRQTADRARDLSKRRVLLGDIRGRLNMLGLLYDPNTQFVSRTVREFLNPELLRNRFVRGPDGRPVRLLSRAEIQDIRQDCLPFLTDPANIDPRERLGFFSIPLKYTKQGVRFDASVQILDDLGFNLQVGLADVRQRLDPTLRDLSRTATPLIVNNTLTGPDLLLPTTTACAVFGITCTCLQYLVAHLMNEIDTIADELRLDLNNFHATDLESIRLGLYARHPFALNQDTHCYPEVLFIPYITAAAEAPVGRQANTRKLFAVPLGNNGHGAVGFAAGMSFLFRETIEAGLEAGMTHFFERQYCNLPLPTSEFQQVLFPFSADVCIQPGNNWHFSVFMNAPRFLDNLSFYAQYVYVSHAEDHVKLLRDLRMDIRALENRRNLPPFAICKVERESKWESQLANFGFNYEISPNFTAGFVWQAPLSGRNAYRSTTILASVIFNY